MDTVFAAVRYCAELGQYGLSIALLMGTVSMAGARDYDRTRMFPRAWMIYLGLAVAHAAFMVYVIVFDGWSTPVYVVIAVPMVAACGYAAYSIRKHAAWFGGLLAGPALMFVGYGGLMSWTPVWLQALMSLVVMAGIAVLVAGLVMSYKAAGNPTDALAGI
jgi:hypothetical protein